MTIDIEQPASDQASSQPRVVTRRAVVRTAAHAAWVMPAAMMASTAPAFAASSRIWVIGFTAAYQNQGNAATVRPDRLVVNATIQNTGPDPTSAVTFTLRIPRGTYPFGGGDLYSSPPTVTPPAGWNAVVSTLGGGAYSHEVEFTAVTQIAGGSIRTLVGAVIQFTDGVNVSPYKAWAGTPFTLQGTVADPNANSGAIDFTTAVADSTSGSLTIDDFQASRNSPAFSTSATLGVWTTNTGGQAVRNTSRKTCGPISFAISWNRDTGHRYYASNPTGARSATPAGWTAVSYTYGATPTATYLSTMAATAPVASTATAANTGTADFGDNSARRTFGLDNEGTFSFLSEGARNITATASATSVAQAVATTSVA